MLLSDASRQSVLRLGFVLGLALLALLLQWLARPYVGSGEPFLFFLPAVALAAVWFGPGPGALVLTAGLASVGLDTVSLHAFLELIGANRVTVGAYLVYGVLLIGLGERMRQRTLRASQAQARLRLLAEETEVGLFEIDRLADTVYLSPPLARLCGVTLPDQVVPTARWVAQLPVPLVAQGRLALASLATQGSERLEHELAWNAPDGPRWLLLRVRLIRDDQARLTHLRGAVVDITERKRMETQLHRTQHELGQQLEDLHLLQALSSRLLETRALQRQLELVLEAVVTLHGARHGVLSLIDPADGQPRIEAAVGHEPPVLEQLQALMRAGGGTCGMARQRRERVVVADFQTDPRCADLRALARETGLSAAHSTPLITESGELLGLISVQFEAPREISQREIDLTDLCARKAIVYTERARARAELEQADRRKDEFLATLAHELRNPLAPIRQAALLSNSPLASEAQKRWSHAVIERQVQHMALLLDDLLDISRITRGVLSLRPARVELSAVVESAVETARPAIDAKGHQLRIELPAEAVGFEADPLRLSQIIANLLTNAAKYTDRSGQLGLTARTEAAAVTTDETETDTAPAREVVIEVSDNGMGIPPESLNDVFTMFTQLRRGSDRVNDGLGIGLALTRGLVELHGGRIAAFSDGPGRGSRFQVRLPLRQPTAAAASIAPVGDAPGAARRILIADDNKDAAESLAVLLRLQGHRVRLAFDGQEAMDAFEDEPADVCLLDIGMPHLDGNEVARRIRARPHGGDAMLVAITGWGQDSDRDAALTAGFDHHLTKPVDPERLDSLLAALGPPDSAASLTSVSVAAEPH